MRFRKRKPKVEENINNKNKVYKDGNDYFGSITLEKLIKKSNLKTQKEIDEEKEQ